MPSLSSWAALPSPPPRGGRWRRSGDEQTHTPTEIRHQQTTRPAKHTQNTHTTNVLFLAFFVRVGRRDRQHRAVVVKVERRDARGALAHLADALLVGAVPRVDDAVAPAGRKRAERRVERDRVDGVHDRLVVDLAAVALSSASRRARRGRQSAQGPPGLRSTQARSRSGRGISARTASGT